MPDIRPLAALALAAALAAAPAAAHHGWADYQPGETTIVGVVQTASLGNPHGVLSVRDADGRVWSVQLAPPAAIARSGLTTPLVPVGARVSAEGHRHNDPARLEIKTERLTVGERTFDLYPARE